MYCRIGMHWSFQLRFAQLPQAGQGFLSRIRSNKFSGSSYCTSHELLGGLDGYRMPMERHQYRNDPRMPLAKSCWLVQLRPVRWGQCGAAWLQFVTVLFFILLLLLCCRESTWKHYSSWLRRATHVQPVSAHFVEGSCTILYRFLINCLKLVRLLRLPLSHVRDIQTWCWPNWLPKELRISLCISARIAQRLQMVFSHRIM